MFNNPIFQLVFTLIVAGGGAYLGSYLREKGKSTATKEDVGHITTIVEQVKTEIGRQDWAHREWTQLRRIKLEELLTHAHGVSRYVSIQGQKALHGERPDEDDPTAELETIAALYFPELEIVVLKFNLERSHLLMHISNLGSKLAAAAGDSDARNKIFDEYLASRDMKAFMQARDNLRAEARALLLRIMPIASGGITE